MKKILTLSLVALAGLAFTACEQCSTCTTISEDPNTEGELLTEEVCGTGRDYDDQVLIYTRAGWDCVNN